MHSFPNYSVACEIGNKAYHYDFNKPNILIPISQSMKAGHVEKIVEKSPKHAQTGGLLDTGQHLLTPTYSYLALAFRSIGRSFYENPVFCLHLLATAHPKNKK